MNCISFDQTNCIFMTTKVKVFKLQHIRAIHFLDQIFMCSYALVCALRAHVLIEHINNLKTVPMNKFDDFPKFPLRVIFN